MRGSTSYGLIGGMHGKDCPKVQHIGAGYLHEHDDDTPYEVDGLWYCGRCHGWMGVKVMSSSLSLDAVEGDK